MTSAVKPIPDGYAAITPYLIIRGAAEAIDYYQRVFGAEVRFRLDEPSGRVGHAELVIGGSVIMIGDEYPEMDIVGPQTVGGAPVKIHLYTEDVDATVERAVAAGAKPIRPIENQFYGDRSGTIEDPFGHHWYIATHVEDVSPEEMQSRAAALFGG